MSLVVSSTPSSSSVPSKYNFKKPSKVMTSPLATNHSSRPETEILATVLSSLALAIWEAKVRL